MPPPHSHDDQKAVRPTLVGAYRFWVNLMMVGDAQLHNPVEGDEDDEGGQQN
ncbi:MAG: hypothetical protein M3305_04605 [Actinomycetota bacterium]|nr:hypothetical protein [Actinomycetota bacterium]